jgi:subtilase family serine protease
LDRISAGGNATAEVNWVAVEGTFQIKVVVDPLNNIVERNETNNTATKQITVVPAPILLPDLQIASQNITWTPEPIHAGDLVDITAFIYNGGEQVGAMPVRFLIDSLYIGELSSGLVSPQNGRIVHQSWTAVLGDHTLTVNIDPFQSSNDSNFTNNVASVQLSVVAVNILKPDPAISNSSITVSPPNPVVGDKVTFSVLVSNVGDQNAINVTVSFYLDGQPLANRTIALLEAGQNPQDVSANCTAKLGTHILMVKLDENGTVDELNESNNTAYASFEVHNLNVLKPDLSISSQSIVLNPSTPVKGQVLKFNVTVQNTGNDSANNVLVLMKVDGKDIGSSTINFIGPGESKLVVGQWVATAGAHTFTVTLDPNGVVNESNEANNQASVSFSLPSDPVSFPWEWIFLGVALVVLVAGVYSFMRSKKGKQGKKPKEPEQTKEPEPPK